MVTTSHKEPYESQTSDDLSPPGIVRQASAQSSTDSDDNDVVIAVMGPTGSGKSTFINLVSGSELGVGEGLESHTAVVQLGDSFDLDGRRVTLVDTPGFDDTNRSDIDVLNMVALFLATLYKSGTKLAGILYFHRISDIRVSGTPVKNLKMFRELCGERSLKNVVVVTSMWEGIDRQVGERREEELRTKAIFFKPVLRGGGQMARHENTIASAQEVLRLVIRNHPLPLRIQEELIDENKDITETGAGEEINRELNAKVRKYKEEIDALREQTEQAIKDKDEGTRRELEEETKRTQDEIERLENDARRLGSDYQRERQEVEDRLKEIEEKAKQDTAQHRKQINKLEKTIKDNANASEKDKTRLQNEARELKEEEKKKKKRRIIWAVIGAVIAAVTGGVSSVNLNLTG